LFWFLMTAV